MPEPIVCLVVLCQACGGVSGSALRFSGGELLRGITPAELAAMGGRLEGFAAEGVGVHYCARISVPVVSATCVG
jgi:hypothetical protein